MKLLFIFVQLAFLFIFEIPWEREAFRHPRAHVALVKTQEWVTLTKLNIVRDEGLLGSLLNKNLLGSDSGNKIKVHVKGACVTV
jgi:hypothetical protein